MSADKNTDYMEPLCWNCGAPLHSGENACWFCGADLEPETGNEAGAQKENNTKSRKRPQKIIAPADDYNDGPERPGRMKYAAAALILVAVIAGAAFFVMGRDSAAKMTAEPMNRETSAPAENTVVMNGVVIKETVPPAAAEPAGSGTVEEKAVSENAVQGAADALLTAEAGTGDTVEAVQAENSSSAEATAVTAEQTAVQSAASPAQTAETAEAASSGSTAKAQTGAGTQTGASGQISRTASEAVSAKQADTSAAQTEDEEDASADGKISDTPDEIPEQINIIISERKTPEEKETAEEITYRKVDRNGDVEADEETEVSVIKSETSKEAADTEGSSEASAQESSAEKNKKSTSGSSDIKTVTGGIWNKSPDNTWVYSIDGNSVTDCWVAGYDGQYYYIDNSGYMLTDGYTPDGYYVGEDGAYDPDGPQN